VLTHIHIRNFTITDEVEVEFGGGMTALTGETGAGKSLLIGALGLVLGDRADSGLIRHGCDRAEIAVGFDIDRHTTLRAWLESRELDADSECQLRRIISREGRSRGYINNQPVPLQALRELGEQLVDIHGQHEHQSLLRSSTQRAALDAFAGHDSLLADVATAFAEWKDTRERLAAVTRSEEDRDARLDLLRYQLQELDALGLQADEISTLEKDHDRLANAGQLLSASRQALDRLYGDDMDSAYRQISQVVGELGDLVRIDDGLAEPTQLLNEILVLVQECADGLRHYSEGLDVDNGQLQELERRIGVLHDLARKHRCKPQELPATRERLQTELDGLEDADQKLAGLQLKLAELEAAYLKNARLLSDSRRKAARRFDKLITEGMQTLGMPGGLFEAVVAHDPQRAFGAHGQDTIEFRVSANPGQPPGPLSKVASGGELSRISLAIQVISSKSGHIPTLIFDEVDSGVGGGVAEIVGQKLRALGNDHQVICVTHLPQVAAQASQQLQVSKLTGDNTTRTRIRQLNPEERTDELARMLGGVKITEQTREHAREMLQQAGDGPAPRKQRKTRKSSA
jgi:DNA repair protein RecN (Recombination protein N)